MTFFDCKELRVQSCWASGGVKGGVFVPLDFLNILINVIIILVFDNKLL